MNSSDTLRLYKHFHTRLSLYLSKVLHKNDESSVEIIRFWWSSCGRITRNLDIQNISILDMKCIYQILFPDYLSGFVVVSICLYANNANPLNLLVYFRLYLLMFFYYLFFFRYFYLIHLFYLLVLWKWLLTESSLGRCVQGWFWSTIFGVWSSI